MFILDENANKPRRLYKVCNAYIARKLAIGKVLFIFLALLFMAGASACEKNTAEPKPLEFVPVEIEFIQIMQGHHWYNRHKDVVCDSTSDWYFDNRQYFVFTDSSTWQDTISNMNVNEICADELSQFAETDIDFSVYQVIAVINEISLYGRTVDITNITEYADKIIVRYTNLEYGLPFATNSHSYHIVKIPRNSKKIIFEYYKK